MKKLIGPTHPNWDDISPFVVHFTKKSATGSEYDNSISILASRCLQAQNRFGMGKNYTESPPVVCFSEVPLHQLKRLADKRGPYRAVQAAIMEVSELAQRAVLDDRAYEAGRASAEGSIGIALRARDRAALNAPEIRDDNEEN